MVLLRTLMLPAIAIVTVLNAQVAFGQQEAVFPGWITGCSAGPFGSEKCPARGAAEVMSSLPIGMLERDLPNADFETFALEEAMRRVGAVALQKASGGSCDTADQALVAAEIMRTKVPTQSRLTGVEAELFGHLVRIVENAIGYVVDDC
ncbi:hypothetical protein [Thalassobius sp. I31.1]|uniref:hypothetical protein n=1 Tax=Thalassobius sp. I31.1 TaxID=2109912 RepID=UPI001300745F|nr:hypothetical protein [Thalassobius sp. I31.1]